MRCFVCVRFVSGLCQVCDMFVSGLCQVCVRFVSRFWHVCVMFVTGLCHVYVMFVSYLWHLWLKRTLTDQAHVHAGFQNEKTAHKWNISRACDFDIDIWTPLVMQALCTVMQPLCTMVQALCTVMWFSWCNLYGEVDALLQVFLYKKSDLLQVKPNTHLFPVSLICFWNEQQQFPLKFCCFWNGE